MIEPITDSGPTGVRPLSSVVKTLAVLEALAGARRSLRLAELSRAMAMARGTTYQRLVTLIRAGWVEQIEDGSFRLTLHATRIGNAALEQASLGDRMVPFLRSLVDEAGETASLAVLDGVDPIIVQRVESSGVLRAELRVGATLSLDHSASGQVLAAFAEPHQRTLFAERGAALPAETVMAAVRATRFAVSTSQRIEGIGAVAAPIFDAAGHCLAALSLVGPLPRFETERMRGPLLAAAERINSFLQGR